MTSKNDNFANQKNPQHPLFHLSRGDDLAVAKNKALQKQKDNQIKSTNKKT